MTKKKNEKKQSTPSKPDFEKVFQTTYYYWRYWIKNLLIGGGLKKFRFIKSEIGYNGDIAIDKPEVGHAKKVLQDYKDKNPEVKDMWW